MPEIEDAVRQASTVHRATEADVAALARTLARAFYDDPHARWTSPDDGKRMGRLERAFVAGLRRIWLEQDECWTTEGVVGGAFWMVPGRVHLGVLRQLGLLPSMLAAYRAGTPRMVMLLNRIDAMHPREREHWYLAFIGVDPEWQGRGIGTALLRPVLERCDREGLPAYLEASSPRNRACYERNGFRVVEEYRVARDAPPGWRMWRDPAG